jgi:hypothetical protein
MVRYGSDEPTHHERGESPFVPSSSLLRIEGCFLLLNRKQFLPTGGKVS